MLLRKYMSLLGIGSARIDLVLEKEHFKPGEAVNGHFSIKGGTIEQRLRRIECDLISADKTNETETAIDSATIYSSGRIQSSETAKIGFCFQLPENLPASDRNVEYRFKTRLIFDEGIESLDQDAIVVLSAD